MRPEPAGDITDDAALGGRLQLLQPRRGHRFGHDAILLAAATPAKAGDLVVDLGAGVGAAALAVAARVPGVRLAMVEIDSALADLAARNAERNGCQGAIVAALDVAAPAASFSRAGIAGGSANCVLMNPPFHDPATTQASPNSIRRLAHAGTRELVAAWIGTAVRLLRDGGALTVIYRADGEDAVAASLASGFGDIAVLPVAPKPGAAAIRIIIGAIKGSKTPPRRLRTFHLNDAGGRPTIEAEDVLRRATALDLTRYESEGG